MVIGVLKWSSLWYKKVLVLYHFNFISLRRLKALYIYRMVALCVAPSSGQVFYRLLLWRCWWCWWLLSLALLFAIVAVIRQISLYIVYNTNNTLLKFKSKWCTSLFLMHTAITSFRFDSRADFIRRYMWYMKSPADGSVLLKALAGEERSTSVPHDVYGARDSFKNATNINQNTTGSNKVRNDKNQTLYI